MDYEEYKDQQRINAIIHMYDGCASNFHSFKYKVTRGDLAYCVERTCQTCGLIQTFNPWIAYKVAEEHTTGVIDDESRTEE